MTNSKLYLALSCLQGRPMKSACLDLLKLKPYGIQLTAGNVPNQDFKEWLNKNNINYLTHHAFSWQHLRQKVWDNTGNCIVKSNSVHPPKINEVDFSIWKNTIKNISLPILETMYQGYYLGTGEEIEEAMSLKINLAVDISHIFIQKCNNLISDNTWKKLQAYDFIKEIHVSSNLGKFDSHNKISKDTFGLDWAIERSNDIPIILESYFHKLDDKERLGQINLLN